MSGGDKARDLGAVIDSVRDFWNASQTARRIGVPLIDVETAGGITAVPEGYYFDDFTQTFLPNGVVILRRGRSNESNRL